MTANNPHTLNEHVFLRVRQARTFGEARTALGLALGMESPASANVTARVLSDQKFAVYLAAVRHFPDWRAKLLNDPANAAFEVPIEKNEALDSKPAMSAARLVQKSAIALAKWGASGFRAIEPWLLTQRRTACSTCPENIEAPKSMLYQLGKIVDPSDTRACNLCGCFIKKKTMNPTEVCPKRSETNPQQSLWGDPMPTN